jgi:hypothetical protein
MTDAGKAAAIIGALQAADLTVKIAGGEGGPATTKVDALDPRQSRRWPGFVRSIELLKNGCQRRGS